MPVLKHVLEELLAISRDKLELDSRMVKASKSAMQLLEPGDHYFDMGSTVLHVEVLEADENYVEADEIELKPG